MRDDGTGIPPNLLPHIFEPFLTTKESGIGLGLAISRGIVERHNGRIEVKSKPGRGTTFTMTLLAPIQGEDASLASAGASNAATKTKLRSGSV